MIELKLYNPAQILEWNNFVSNSKNATFIHFREYMDYHSARFTDSSIIAYSGNTIIALLPANRVGNTLHTHQGLSFGGWLTQTKHDDVTTMLKIFEAMKVFLNNIGINEIIYRAIPHIYHSYPAEEDLYAIFKNKGILVASSISATSLISNPIRFNENSRRAIKHATQAGVVIEESVDYAAFWAVLTCVLQERHNTSPVHSLSEIEMLHNSFPSNIRLFCATINGEILGGVVIYCYRNVAHAQYIAASQHGRELKVLPLLFEHLISTVFRDFTYFDFGTSNEENGQILNEGLSLQKTGMGGRGIVYNTYKIIF